MPVVYVMLAGSVMAQSPAPAKSLAESDKPAVTQGVAHDDVYVIGPSDVLSINVWK
jgi:protein involved in polysaccharide export with SLBB domain